MIAHSERSGDGTVKSKRLRRVRMTRANPAAATLPITINVDGISDYCMFASRRDADQPPTAACPNVLLPPSLSVAASGATSPRPSRPGSPLVTTPVTKASALKPQSPAKPATTGPKAPPVHKTTLEATWRMDSVVLNISQASLVCNADSEP